MINGSGNSKNCKTDETAANIAASATAFMREREAEKFFITVSLQKKLPLQNAGAAYKAQASMIRTCNALENAYADVYYTGMYLSFFHPDFYRRYGNLTRSAAYAARRLYCR